MDAVKNKPTAAVDANRAYARTLDAHKVSERPHPAAQPAAHAASKPPEPPRPTTNTRGETLGRHLNVTA